MTSINTIYNNYAAIGLSYLLGNNQDNGNNNNNTSNSTGSGSGAPASLATIMNNNSSSNGNDLVSLLENSSGFRNYSLPTDANGNTYIPTIDQMNNASSPDTQLSLANYVSQAVLMQADAATKTGIASRATDIVGQAQSVLTAVANAVSGLGDGLSQAQQTTVSTALNAINTTLTEVKALLPKTSSDTQASVTASLTNLDTLGANIALATGVSWNTVTGNGNNTVSGYSAASSATPTSGSSSSLLNIMA